MAKVQSRRPGRTSSTSSARVKKNSTSSSVKWEFPLEKKDFIWLAIGVGIVIIGYALLATGISDDPAVEGGKWMNALAVDIAPIVLLIGYLVVIPMALMKFFTRNRKKKNSSEISTEEKI